MKNIFLVGFMGSGKTAIGKLLSEKLSWQFIDTDEEIVRTQGQQIKDIFRNKGEDFFRELETNTLKSMVGKKQCIVSCGGGIVLKDENISIMKSQGSVVWLVASPKTIYNRVSNDTRRPLLQNNMSADYIEKMLESRKANYIKSADYIFSTEEKTPEEIVGEIIEKLEV